MDDHRERTHLRKIYAQFRGYKHSLPSSGMGVAAREMLRILGSKQPLVVRFIADLSPVLECAK